MNDRLTLLSFVAVAAMILFALPLAHAEDLPDPDGKPAAADKPVKVFILLGQSNM